MLRLAALTLLLISAAVCEEKPADDRQSQPAGKAAPKTAAKALKLEDLPKDLADKLKKIDFKALGLEGVQPVSVLNAAPISLQAPAVTAVAAPTFQSPRVAHAPFTNPIPPRPLQGLGSLSPLGSSFLGGGSPLAGLRNRNPLRAAGGSQRQRGLSRAGRPEGRSGPLAGLGLGSGLGAGGRAGRLNLGGGGLSLAQAQRPSLFRSRPQGQRSGPGASRSLGLGLTRSLGGARDGSIIGRRQRRGQ